jgi:hypothetical protein
MKCKDYNGLGRCKGLISLRSLLIWDQGVVGSNPITPTKIPQENQRFAAMIQRPKRRIASRGQAGDKRTSKGPRYHLTLSVGSLTPLRTRTGHTRLIRPFHFELSRNIPIPEMSDAELEKHVELALLKEELSALQRIAYSRLKRFLAAQRPRGNPGGRMQEAVKFARLLMDDFGATKNEASRISALQFHLEPESVSNALAPSKQKLRK